MEQHDMIALVERHLKTEGAGDIDGAVAEYQKLVDANPADTEAAGGLAMAKVLQRTQGADEEGSRRLGVALHLVTDERDHGTDDETEHCPGDEETLEVGDAGRRARVGGAHPPRLSEVIGRSPSRWARCPLARTCAPARASLQARSPTTSRSHVTPSVSMTLGGVPRVCTGPSMHLAGSCA